MPINQLNYLLTNAGNAARIWVEDRDIGRQVYRFSSAGNHLPFNPSVLSIHQPSYPILPTLRSLRSEQGCVDTVGFWLNAKPIQSTTPVGLRDKGTL